MKQKILLWNESGTTSMIAPPSLVMKSSVMSQKPWSTWKKRQAHPPVRVADFAEVFQLPTIAGEEDEEMITTDSSALKMSLRCKPMTSPLKTNEAGILDFLASVAEHSKDGPHDDGDILCPNDYEAEFNGPPFKVIDEYYGGSHRGRGIWGHHFRNTHALPAVTSTTAAAQ